VSPLPRGSRLRPDLSRCEFLSVHDQPPDTRCLVSGVRVRPLQSVLFSVSVSLFRLSVDPPVPWLFRFARVFPFFFPIPPLPSHDPPWPGLPYARPSRPPFSHRFRRRLYTLRCHRCPLCPLANPPLPPVAPRSRLARTPLPSRAVRIPRAPPAHPPCLRRRRHRCGRSSRPRTAPAPPRAPGTPRGCCRRGWHLQRRQHPPRPVLPKPVWSRRSRAPSRARVRPVLRARRRASQLPSVSAPRRRRHCRPRRRHHPARPAVTTAAVAAIAAATALIAASAAVATALPTAAAPLGAPATAMRSGASMTKELFRSEK
jgi:hypothetical protein